MDFETFASKVGPRDRLNLERHVAVLEATGDAEHLAIWKRLAAALMTLAPIGAKTVGQQTVQYFIPDGKYRMQVFALHDGGDHKILVYAPNVLNDAIEAGLIARDGKMTDNLRSYSIADSRDTISIEELDSKTGEPSMYFKDMLGWNRKAIRITLLTTSTESQLAAAESLCAIAAKKWTA